MIYVDLTWWTVDHGGVQNFTKHLISVTSKQPGFAFIIAEEDRNNNLFKDLSHVEYIRRTPKYEVLGRFWFYYFRLIKLGQLQKKLKSTILYPAHPGSLFKYSKIVYINHDICSTSNPELFGRGFHEMFYWKYYHNLFTKRADIVATVSETSKKDISSRLGYPLKDIHVIPNIVDVEIESIHEVKINRKQLLFIGALIPRKNTKTMLDIARYLKNNHHHEYSVIVVGKSTKYWSILKNDYDTNRLPITEYSYISEKDKKKLFNESILIYPSLCEGFGIPVIEAISNGCQVICNSIPIMNEILGDSGYTLNMQGDYYEDLISMAKNVCEDITRFRNLQTRIMERYNIKVFEDRFLKMISAMQSKK